MKRKLNLRFVACVLLATAVLGVGIHFLHGRQVKRNAGALLQQAERAEAEGDSKQAADLLERYLILEPADNAARIRFGQVLDGMATANKNGRERVRAYLVLSEALRRDPSNQDLRRQVVRLAMALYQFDDAREHLTVLLQSSPNDGELERYVAQCHAAKREFRDAASWLTKAIAHSPTDVEGYVALADLQRHSLDQPKQASETMAALLKANPRSAAAHLRHAEFCLSEARAAGRSASDPLVQEAERDVGEARKLAPGDLEVQLMAAHLAELKGDKARARQTLEGAAREHPADARPYLQLARTQQRAGQPADAAATLRKGVEALPQSTDLLWALAELLAQPAGAGQATAEVPDLIARLTALHYPAPPLDYLRGRLLAAEGKWQEAAAALTAADRSLAKGWPHLVQPTLLLLALCYDRLGESDEAYEVYRRVLQRDPLCVPAALGEAARLTAWERYDDALEAYHKILGKAPEAGLAAARVILLKNLRLPQAQRHWGEFNDLLAQAERQTPHSVEAALLRADMLASQPGGLDRADAQLAAARDAHPDDLRPWLALAKSAQRRQDPAKAQEILGQAQKRFGDRVELRLARADLAVARGGEGTRQALGRQAEGTDRWSARDRERLLEGLANSYLRTGDLREARQLWAQLAQARPNDLRVRLRLLELALQADDEESARRWLDRLGSEDGSNGTTVRYAWLCYHIWHAGRGHREELAQARSLLETLSASRPGWSRLAVCEAQISELEGEPARAIKAYQRALEAGERDPAVVRRAVLLLYERQRFAEAYQIVRTVAEDFFSAPEMRRTVVDLALRAGDSARALELAQAAVAHSGSGDYRDYLAYAVALAATPDRRKEAEAALERATELAPTQPEVWVARVRYLAGAGRRGDAEAVIARAQQALPAERAPLALARCRQAVGDQAGAERLFQEALKPRPNDVHTLRAAAEFYASTGKLTETQASLRQLIAAGPDSAPDVAWARRSLAVLLAAAGNGEQRRDALALLAGGPDASPADEGVEARHARALVLASQRDLKQREQAIAILEDLKAKRPPSARDQFLLAQLYETTGETDKARTQLETLLSAPDAQPGQLAYLARRLLAHGEQEEARRCLEQIEKLAANSPEAVEIRARLLKAGGDAAAATASLRRYAGTDPERSAVAAEWLEEIGEFGPAEEMYRRAATSPDKPERVLLLAQFLGRRHRTREALLLCDGAWRACKPADVAATSIAVLYAGGRDDDGTIRVERKIQAALEAAPDNIPLLLALATLRKLQGRYAEAIAGFEQVVKADGHHPVALNNLAWLLALHAGRAEEALDLIQQAIREVGLDPALLDTRAVIYLALAQAAPAVGDLRMAVAARPSASLYFHLARAHVMAGNREEALTCWQKAKSLGMAPEDVEPLERTAYQQTAAQLERK